ncbi:hypothetical protein [Methylobacterium sp. PvR107]|uniref:hypothetical protein n=1 Tax=Methylobacterium sp. PvR107 TaxID=2806597 RepID=UPI001AEA8DD1|nr:hypothetical protein [Methylobacterium sp. PvR107]MBP1181696.1 hypothetical protein [Methylobacterium sp. PvR107]
MTLITKNDYAGRTDSSAQGLHFITASARQPARQDGDEAGAGNAPPIFVSDDVNSAFLDDFVKSDIDDIDDVATGWQSIFAPVPKARADQYAVPSADSSHFSASGGHMQGVGTSSSGSRHFGAASDGDAHGVEIPSSGNGHLSKSSDGSARAAGASSDDSKHVKINVADDSLHNVDAPSSVKFGTLTTSGEKAPEWTGDEISSGSKVARKSVGVSVHNHTESESFVPAVDDDHGGAIDRAVSELLQGSTSSSSAALGVRGDTVSDFTPTQNHINTGSLTDIGAITGFSTESAHPVDVHHALGLTGFEF